MITIRKTLFDELTEITNIGNQNHISNFLSKKSRTVHENDFIKNNTIYLSIINEAGLLAGYIILNTKTQTQSIQLKRILVDKDNLGIGQQAILATEKYCIREFNCNHNKNNEKAIYIYKKLGYKKFKENTQHTKTVFFYEKML